MWCRNVAKRPKIAGDALSKSGGNFDHHHHHLVSSTVLEAVQRRGHQVQGPVGTGYQVEGLGSTVLTEVHTGNKGKVLY